MNATTAPSPDELQDEVSQLVRLNERIGEAESAADRGFFEELLMEQFVMLRPSGVLDNRATLLDGLAPGASRRTSRLEVQLYGTTRAVVTCLVTKWDGDDPDPDATAPAGADRFHNLRVFLRTSPDADWKLLSWLNEPAPQPAPEPAIPTTTGGPR